MNKNLLTADIGGTHSRFLLFLNHKPTKEIVYSSKKFNCFEELLDVAKKEHPQLFEAEKGCFAFAGTVHQESFPLTNLPWTIHPKKIETQLGMDLHCLNDLEAGVMGIETLPIDSFKTLQMGKEEEGCIALISPGTGLGEAFLTKKGEACPTEGGHADFAPVNELQVELFRFLKEKYGRVSYEHVLSGQGIWNIYSFLKRGSDALPEGEDKGLNVWKAAFKFHDQMCMETLRLFTTILAQEAGNLALHTLPKKGLYIAGGIVPHIMPYLEECTFLDTFCQKGAMNPLLQSIPIKVLLNEQLNLFGCGKVGYGTP